MARLVININMDRRCAECGKQAGVAENGLCLGCVSKAVQGKPMRSDVGKAVAARVRQHLGNPKPKRR